MCIYTHTIVVIVNFLFVYCDHANECPRHVDDWISLKINLLGKYGSLVYVVTDAQGREMESSGYLYHARVTAYTVSGEIDDGIFEPGETIEIRNMKVSNVGGLTMPSGTVLQFFDNSTISFVENYLVIPNDVPPGTTFHSLSITPCV